MASYPGKTANGDAWERLYHLHIWEIIVPFYITTSQKCSPTRTRREKMVYLKVPKVFFTAAIKFVSEMEIKSNLFDLSVFVIGLILNKFLNL